MDFSYPVRVNNSFASGLLLIFRLKHFSPMGSVTVDIAISMATRYFVSSYYVCLKISVLEIPWRSHD